MSEFTGYLIDDEPIDQLVADAIDFDFAELVCGDFPDTRGIKSMMKRTDQYRMNSCAGFGTTHSANVAFWCQTGTWREFNPLFAYREGQKVSGIRGDRGATIHGVTSAARKVGLLVKDVEGDGKDEFPYYQDYNHQFPASVYQLAAQRKVGYTAVLKSWDAMMNFLRGNQGGIVVGGPWGNWGPDRNGVYRNYRSGGGGHARAIVDWEKRGNEYVLVEANSHFKNFGDNGFGYVPRDFMEDQLADGRFVAIGISDINLAPGDVPKRRPYRQFVKF